MAHSDFSLKPQKVPFVNTKFRKIRTAIPTPGTEKILKTLHKYESRSMHGQLPVIWEKAKDFQVFDKAGNTWIDFTSTIFVANTGHSNKKIIKSLQEQLKKPLLHTYTFPSEIRAKFLKKLVEMTPAFCQKSFLMSSGTEASECAIKLIRMYGQKTNEKKIGIIAFTGSMHGRTMGAEMLRGNKEMLKWIGFKDPNIFHIPFPYPWLANNANYDWEEHFNNDIAALKKNGADFSKIAGFAIESYQGWGAILYPAKYIQALAKFAKEHNILLMFDEIQSGFGRTGKLFCYQHYGVEPDLLCLGKGISGGVPLSAVIGRKEILDTPEFGSMSSTHSAQPLGCAAGLANLEEIQTKNLVKESAKKGLVLHKKLSELKSKHNKHISYILGKGLVAAILTKNTESGEPNPVLATKVCEKAMQKGLLLVHTGRESIKIGPPLTIPDKALIEGIEVIDECFKEAISENKF